MNVANKGIKYSSRCRNKGATILRRVPGCYVLFPRFRMKTTLKTAASCALPPGVYLCRTWSHSSSRCSGIVFYKGAKRLIFFRSDGGKKCATGAKYCCCCLFSRLRKISHPKFGLKSCESEKSEALSCSVVQCRLPVWFVLSFNLKSFKI